MNVLTSPGSGELIEKKSRFLGFAMPVRSEEEAAAAIAALRKEHWDARHCCSAFILGERGELSRCSDDGEPSQTAGRPILDVLQKAELTDALIVVVRYFGGVLLGTGGLTRAYRGAAEAALADAALGRLCPGRRLTLDVEYGDLAAAEKALRAAGLSSWDAEFGARVQIAALIPAGRTEALAKDLANGTLGRARLHWEEECTYIEKIEKK